MAAFGTLTLLIALVLATYAGVTNFDFVYHTAANGSWIDSNTPVNNTGNITG